MDYIFDFVYFQPSRSISPPINIYEFEKPDKCKLVHQGYMDSSLGFLREVKEIGKIYIDNFAADYPPMNDYLSQFGLYMTVLEMRNYFRTNHNSRFVLYFQSGQFAKDYLKKISILFGIWR